MRAWAHSTFASLKVRNYRLFFTGQAFSVCGSWTQNVAQSWLVLQLSNSGYALGIVVALQCLPVFVLAPYGGVLADRFSKRKLLFTTQSCSALLALALGTLVAFGVVRLWMVYGFALLLGCINSIDNPTRQSFVHELVGLDTIRNAVTLNSLELNLCRVIGPMIAGALILNIGLAPCFIFNGLSFCAVLWSLRHMAGSELHRSTPVKAEKGQIKQGLIYAYRTPAIFYLLLMLAIIGTLTFEFQVSLPLLAQFSFSGDVSAYSSLMSAMGAGAIVGGLLTAERRTASFRGLTFAAFGFGVAMIAVSFSPTLIVALLSMIVVGIFSITFTSICNARLQIEAVSNMRGRVMALWSVAFQGSTLIGAPIIGLIGEHLGPRWGVFVGGVAALVAAAVGLYVIRTRRPTPPPSELVIEAPSITGKEDGV